jgi:hypothetical protein
MVKEKKDDSPHGKVVNYKSQKHSPWFLVRKKKLEFKSLESVEVN